MRACVTVSGRILGSDPRKALNVWATLPESERRPAAVEPRTSKGGYHPPEPPKNGLILRAYYRTLTRDANGELRHATIKDFKTGRSEATKSLYFNAQPDFVWLTEAEWKSLVPDKPKAGDRLPVAAGIRQRLYRFHLDPRNFYSATTALSPDLMRGGELTLVVKEVSDDAVQLRLEGVARLGIEPGLALELAAKKKQGFAYEPRVLGFLTYDYKKKAFIRFDVAALGDLAGLLTDGDFAPWYRPGLQPLGAAFELVGDDTPANHVPPRGLMTGPIYWYTPK